MRVSLFCRIRCIFKRLSVLVLFLQSNWHNTVLYIRPQSVLPNWFHAALGSLAPLAPSRLITVIDYSIGVPSLRALWDLSRCLNHILKQPARGWSQGSRCTDSPGNGNAGQAWELKAFSKQPWSIFEHSTTESCMGRLAALDPECQWREESSGMKPWWKMQENYLSASTLFGQTWQIIKHTSSMKNWFCSWLHARYAYKHVSYLKVPVGWKCRPFWGKFKDYKCLLNIELVVENDIYKVLGGLWI